MDTITSHKQKALGSLQTRWGSAILATLIYRISFGAVLNIVLFVIATPVFLALFLTKIIDFDFLKLYIEHLKSGGMPPAGMEEEMYRMILIACCTYVIIVTFVQLVVSPPFAFGILNYFKRLVENGETKIETIYSGFKLYFKAFRTILAISFFTSLWSLLFIVPGIIAGFRYSQTIYIILNDPNIGVLDAMKKSSKMMNGHKMEYFLLNLSFIGWILLASLTFGIGYLFLLPYLAVTDIYFHNSIKKSEMGNSQVAENTTAEAE